MSIQPISLPRGQPSYNQLVAAVETLLNQLARHPLANLKVLPAQTINPTDTRIFHGLGQRPTGYFIVKSTSGSTVFDGLAAETADPSNYLMLRSSAGMPTVTLAVF